MKTKISASNPHHSSFVAIAKNPKIWIGNLTLKMHVKEIDDLAEIDYKSYKQLVPWHLLSQSVNVHDISAFMGVQQNTMHKGN